MNIIWLLPTIYISIGVVFAIHHYNWYSYYPDGQADMKEYYKQFLSSHEKAKMFTIEQVKLGIVIYIALIWVLMALKFVASMFTRNK